NAHDRVAAHRLAAARHLDLGVEAVDALDELGGRPRMQALAVDDADFARQGAGEFGRRGTILFACRGGFRFAHLPAKTLLATVMYLRPASRASPTACSRSAVSLTEASLMSIG